MRILILPLLLVFSIQSSSQEYFIKKHGLNSINISGFTLDNYREGQYLLGGLKRNPDTLLYLYVGIVNDDGNIMQYDSIPQIEQLISINLNNDFNLLDGIAYYYSNGSGNSILYSYDIIDNDLVALDTFKSSEVQYYTRDFLSYSKKEHLFIGDNGFSGEDYRIGFVKKTEDSYQYSDDNASETKKFVNRVFHREDGSFAVLTRYNPPGPGTTVGIFNYDQELNLVDSLVGDFSVIRAQFTDAIRDKNGDYVYGCRWYDAQAEGAESKLNPMISKIYQDGRQWDLVIGRTYTEDGLISGWYGLIESVEGDGYVAAGTMLIRDLVELDTIMTLGALTKVSEEGESLWYREFSTIDTSYAFTYFRDVVATSDGYMIIGDEYCFPDFSGCDRSTSLVIIRTDSEGRILPDSTDSVITLDKEGLDISVYPNPVRETLYVQHELGSSAEYRIIDITGRIVREFSAGSVLTTIKVSVEGLIAGSYFLQLIDENGDSREVGFVKG